MAKRSIKVINADREFVKRLRIASKKVEDRLGLKMSDSQATKILTPYVERIFDPMDNLDDIKKKKKKRRDPLKIF